MTYDMAHIRAYLQKIRDRRPVVQCITNIVTVNDCANALLAIGGSPTMAHHPLEMEDFAKICDALVCNMGATESLEAMEKAAVEAGRRGHPIVVDPVGCAGSPFRREQCIHLMRTAPLSCIRGNAAEIRALAENCNTGRGVDDREPQEPGGRFCGPSTGTAEMKTEPGGRFCGPSTNPGEEKNRENRPCGSSDVERDITALARQTGAIVIATGAIDRIGDGERILEVGGGTPMLAKITGSGCMLSAMLGAFMAVDRSAESAAACCAMMKSCGEQADRWTREAGRGTGTFHMALMDALSLILAS